MRLWALHYTGGRSRREVGRGTIFIGQEKGVVGVVSVGGESIEIDTP